MIKITPTGQTLKISSLKKGLVLDLSLDKESLQNTNTFADKTPYENKGTSVNNPVFTTDQNGQANRAMRFNGISDVIRIVDSNSLGIVSTMSVFAWVKGAAQENKGIIGKFDYSLNKVTYLLYSSSSSPYQKMVISISDDGSWTSGHRKHYISSVNILDNSWHFMGFTFNAGTLKLYIDSVEDTVVTKTYDDAITTISVLDQDLTIGSYLNNNIPVGFIAADISGAKTYNHVLDPTEITKLYKAYRPKILI